MRKNDHLNDLFLAVVKGDSSANTQLFGWFFNKGLTVARSIARQNHVYTLHFEDYGEILSEIYQDTIASYDLTVQSFERFAKFMLRRRLTSDVMRKGFDKIKQAVSLDTYDEKTGGNLYDLIASDEENLLHRDITSDEYSMQLSSGKKEKEESRIDRLRREARILRFRGFSKKDTMKILRLTDGQYRYIMRLNNRDAKLNKFKLELK